MWRRQQRRQSHCVQTEACIHNPSWSMISLSTGSLAHPNVAISLVTPQDHEEEEDIRCTVLISYMHTLESFTECDVIILQ